MSDVELCRDCLKRPADGVDEQGYATCERCADRAQVYREADDRRLMVTFEYILEWVHKEGLPAHIIRDVVDAELAGEGLTDTIIASLEEQFDFPSDEDEEDE